MAFEKISLQTKLNKGTSKSEYGELNFWGYKAGDGIIRARLFSPDTSGICLLEVKKFVLAPNSWRRKVTWDEATVIGSSYVKISDTDKGFTSAEALKEVNALIEIHNDYFEANVGRMVRQPLYGGGHRPSSDEVTGVSFQYDSQDSVIVELHGSGWRAKLSECIDYTDDHAHALVAERLGKVQEEIDKAQSFLNQSRDAYIDGRRMPSREGKAYESMGMMPYSTANEITSLVNQFVPEEVTAG